MRLSLSALAVLTLAAGTPAASRAATSRDVLALFADPPREYSAAVVWTWSPDLTQEQVRRMMRGLARQEVRQVFVQPEPGRPAMPLCQERLPLWKAALDEARGLDMSVWLYGGGLNEPRRSGDFESLLQACRKELGGEFGKHVPGIFVEAPSSPLPAPAKLQSDRKQARHDHHQALLEQIIERQARPLRDACTKAGLELAVGVRAGRWPQCREVPDNMALHAWSQRPAIEIRATSYGEGVHAEFGNVRAVRELSSVANQLELPRTLCKVYGEAAADLGLQDRKRVTDWLLVLGVNTIQERISLRQSWWSAYHEHAVYTARLAAALSQGKQVQPFLLLEPTTTAWFYQADPEHADRLDDIGQRFQKLVMRLEAAQVEYDIGSEDIIARHGSVRVRRLKVGKRGYRAVILPPLVENLSAKTSELLDELTTTGGKVFVCGDLPDRIAGRPAGRQGGSPGEMPYGWQRVEPADLPAVLSGLTSDGFAIHRKAQDRGLLFHHRRRLDDGELLFLVNTSDTESSSGTVASPARGVRLWNLETGEAAPAFFRSARGGVELPFDLPPRASILAFFSWEACDPAPAPSTSGGPKARQVKNLRRASTRSDAPR